MTGATDALQTGTEQVRSAASDAAGQVQEKASDVAEQARAKASEVTDQGRSLLRSKIEERSSQAGQQLHSQVQDLRTLGEQLRDQGKEGPAKIADQVAEKGEQVAAYLRTTDGDRLLRDVEGFARRQPWAVVGAGLALGFVAARFLKSSSSQRYASGRLNNLDHVSTRSRDELRSNLSSFDPNYSGYRPVSGYADSPVSEGL